MNYPKVLLKSQKYKAINYEGKEMEKTGQVFRDKKFDLLMYRMLRACRNIFPNQSKEAMNRVLNKNYLASRHIDSNHKCITVSFPETKHNGPYESLYFDFYPTLNFVHLQAHYSGKHVLVRNNKLVVLDSKDFWMYMLNISRMDSYPYNGTKMYTPDTLFNMMCRLSNQVVDIRED